MSTLLRWLSRWPLWLLHGVGSAAGWLTWLASPAYRGRFRANARAAGLQPRQIRPAVAQAGRLLMELPLLWMRPATQPILGKIEWDGLALIDAAHAAGRGIVFLTPHLGSFEV